MSTTPIDTWAVDLADVTLIYPGVGFEVAMFWIAVALWIAWHAWQIKHENAEYAEQVAKYGDSETIRKTIEND